MSRPSVTTTSLALAALALALTAALAACGDDDGAATPAADAGAPGARTTADDCPPRTPDSGDLLDLLRAAPCVADVVEVTAQRPDARAFLVSITQLVDHQDPASATFEQHLTVVIRDPTAPTILVSTGYHDYMGQYPSELTELFDANQIVVEHRNFGASIPSPPAWEQLTIANAADDHHQVVAALAPILTGAWLSTGASKGGMTSVYHRRFWPDDVAGTVAYVAPLSLGAPDPQYEDHIARLGPPACREALAALTRELLTNRRATFEARVAAQAAETGATYTRVSLGAAVEWAFTDLSWSYWQYYGDAFCDQVPSPSDDDDALWSFVEQITGAYALADDELGTFEAYYYQAATELGFPDEVAPGMTDVLQYGPEDYAGFLPTDATPLPYTPAAMADIDAWVQTHGARLLFVYGEWDPWSGGPFHVGAAVDSALYTEARGTHGASLTGLASADRADALARLGTWAGVAAPLPDLPRRPALRAHRLPPGAR